MQESPTDSRATRTVRFGVFEVDIHARELHRDGLRIRIQEQPFQILATLLSRPGEIVTREELRRQLWPTNTFVDFDIGLNSAVKKLRHALKDHSDNPCFIETVPRRGYRFIGNIAPTTDNRRNRLAVLPFENLNSAEEEYFSDGLTEQMIARLGGSCKCVDVVAPVSVMQYKAAKIPHLACEDLRADYLLAGSVLRSNGEVRITARLTRTGDQCCIWADSYTRDAREVLLVQDEITRNIVRSVVHVFSPVQFSESHLITTASAYEEYLMARRSGNIWSVPGFFEAKRHVDAVLAEDPHFAPAYGFMSLMYAAIAAWGVFPVDLAYRNVESTARKGLALSEQLEEAYCALGWKLFDYDADLSAAEKYLLRASEINPSFSLPHILSGQVAGAQGRFDVAIARLARAVELDPLSPLANTTAGCVYYLAGRLLNARESFERIIRLYPRLGIAHTSLSWIYLAQGNLEAALAASEFGTHCDSENTVSRATLAIVLATAGSSQAVSILQELLCLQEPVRVPPYWIAQIYLALGNTSEAIAWLETAFTERCSWRLMAGVDPKLQPLAAHPRFQRLLSGIGLPNSIACCAAAS